MGSAGPPLLGPALEEASELTVLPLRALAFTSATPKVSARALRARELTREEQKAGEDPS